MYAPFCHPPNRRSGVQTLGCWLIALLLCVTGITSALATSYPRTATLETRDTELYLDLVGRHSLPMELDSPPVYWEGQWYGPGEELAGYLGVQTRFDPTEGWVQLTTEGLLHQEPIQPWVEALARTSYEKRSLQRIKEDLTRQLDVPQVHPARQELAQVDTRDELEDFFNDVFGWLRGVPLTFDVGRDGTDRLRVNITLEEEDRQDFERLSRTVVTSYVDDMIQAALDLYPRKTEVTGRIRAENRRTSTLLDFAYTGEDERPRIDFDYTPSDPDGEMTTAVTRRMERHLLEVLDEYRGAAMDYRVQPLGDDAKLIVWMDRDAYEDWSSTRREAFLDRVAEEMDAQVEEEITVVGEILSSDRERFLASFELEGDRLRWISEEEEDFRDDEDHWREWEREVARPDFRDPSPIVEPEIERHRVTVAMMPLVLEVDGVPFNSRESMFIWQDTLYLPLGELVDALYLTLTFKEADNELVIGTNPAAREYSFPTMLLDLMEMEETVAALQEDVETLREEVTARDERPMHAVPYRRIDSLSEMEYYLEDYYDTIEGIRARLSLRHLSGHRYRLRISYDQEDFQRFDALSQQRVENWIYEMQSALRELYDRDGRLEGRIRSTPYDRDEMTLITFEPRDRRLTFDFEDHGGDAARRLVDTDDLADALRDELRRYGGQRFSYSAGLIRRDVELEVVTDRLRFMDRSPEWHRDYLDEMAEILQDHFPGTEVDGAMVESREEEPFYRFSVADGTFRSHSLRQHLERTLNREEARFDDLWFTYRLREDREGAVRLRMEGDFAAGDAPWTQRDSDAFEAWLDELMDRVETVLPQPVFLKVEDRTGEVLVFRGEEEATD